MITHSGNWYVSLSNNILEYLFLDGCSVSYWLETLNRWAWTYTETLYRTTHLRLKSWVWKCVYLVSVLAFIKFFVNFRNVPFTKPDIQENQNNKFIIWFGSVCFRKKYIREWYRNHWFKRASNLVRVWLIFWKCCCENLFFCKLMLGE